MGEKLSNLFYTIVGGLIVAAGTYFFFSPTGAVTPTLDIQYRYWNISGLPSIISDIFLERLDFTPPDGGKISDDEKRRVKSVINDSQKYNYIYQAFFSSLNRIEIFNQTDTRISDIEIINQYENPMYLLNESSPGVFLKIEKNERHKLDFIDPSSKLFLVVFSSDVSEYRPEPNVVILAGGKRQPIDLPVSSMYESEPFATLAKYPFWTSIIFASGIVALFALVVGLFVESLKKISPDLRWKLTSKTEYENGKKLVEFYESSAAKQKASSD